MATVPVSTFLVRDTEANILALSNAAGTEGRVGFTTDTSKVYYDTGSAWVEIKTTPGTEATQDIIGAMVAAAGGSYNDGANTIDLGITYQFAIKEVDGSPSDSWLELEMPNGTLSDQGGGTVRYTPAGGSLPTGGAVNAALVKRGDGDGDADWRPLLVPAPLDPTTAIGDLLYRDPDTVTTLAIGFVGDSITGNTPGGGAPPPDQVADALTAHGLTVTVENQGQSGSATADWLPADASDYLTDAKATFAGAGVRLVHVMLGTNDSKTTGRVSVDDYRDHLLAICADLVLAGHVVVLAYPLWLDGTTQWDATSQARLAAYQAEIDSLVNGVTVFLGDTTAYHYFQDNPGDLSDGVHPDASGAATLGNLWAAALTPYVRGLAGAQAWKALPIGSTGQVLKSDGARPTWDTDATGGGGGGGGLVALDEATVGSGGAASIAFTSIDQGYAALVIAVDNGRTEGSAIDYLCVRYNGDAGAHYSSLRGATTLYDYGEGRMMLLAGTTITAPVGNTQRLTIPGYAATTGWKVGSGLGGDIRAHNDLAFDNWVVVWQDTAAITDILLFAAAGNDLAEGMHVVLYGVPGV